jgi:type IV secretory pathway TraG/TraD family ATPase VirD4
VSGDKARRGHGEIDDGHVITIAGTGSGKGVAAVLPNLLTYEGSCVVVDPKGENFMKTAEARARMGHRICLVDPFNTVARADLREQYRTRFSPLEVLGARHAAGDYGEVIDEAAVIAGMLVVTTDQERDQHWNDQARSFIKAAVLFVTFGALSGSTEVPADARDGEGRHSQVVRVRRETSHLRRTVSHIGASPQRGRRGFNDRGAAAPERPVQRAEAHRVPGCAERPGVPR